MTPLEEELLELVVALAEAVQLARGEFEDLREIPQPTPDDLDVRLTERLILIATLKRLREEAPDHVVELVVGWYREEREKAPHDEYDLPNFPPLPEVEAQLDAAYDTVRRRRLLVPELYRALGPF